MKASKILLLLVLLAGILGIILSQTFRRKPQEQVTETLTDIKEELQSAPEISGPPEDIKEDVLKNAGEIDAEDIELEEILVPDRNNILSQKDDLDTAEMIEDIESKFPEYDPLNDPRDPLRYRLPDRYNQPGYPGRAPGYPGSLPKSPLRDINDPLKHRLPNTRLPRAPVTAPQDPLRYRLNQ